MARIIIIDDEPSVLMALEQLLRSIGHQVILAEDARKGILTHQTQPADLIITDLYMPEQDGVETIVQLKKLSPDVPIIAMTGNVRSNIMDVAKKLGVKAVLEKPFQMEHLLQVVEEALKPKYGERSVKNNREAGGFR
jgi:DNA-binding NtrC family response regulator